MQRRRTKWYLPLALGLIVLAVIESICWTGLRLRKLIPQGGYSAAYDQLLESFRYPHPYDIVWTKVKPHPYWGFAPSQDPRADNYGFLNGVSLPYRKKSPNEYVIAVFGGSFAQGFVTDTRDSETLVHELKSRSKTLRSKKIVLLSLSQGSFRQPQIFHVLAYFLDTVDMAIVIDGFNDLVAYNGPEYPMDYPLASSVLFPHGYGSVREFGRKVFFMGLLRDVTDKLITPPPLCYSSGIFVAWSVAKMWIERSSRSDPVDERNFYYDPQMPENALVSKLANRWGHYTRLESAILRDSGKPYAIFLQPNQYIKESKPLTKHELLLIASNHHYEPLRVGYRGLQKAQTELRSAGYNVFDQTQAFAGNREDLYIDGCCHVNPRGNVIFAKSLVDTLLREKVIY